MEVVRLEAGGGRGPTMDSRGSEDEVEEEEGAGEGGDEGLLRGLRAELVEPVF